IYVIGLGGVGKTQLVVELLFRTNEKHPDCFIIWIPATNMESLHQAYLDVARQLSIAEWEDDTSDVKRLVQGYLGKESTGRWLLVFDNADDIDMWIAKAGSGLQPGQGSQPLIDYLPKSKQGAILFTTRDRKIAVKLAQQNVVDVPAMGEDAAAQLLEKCLVNPDLVDGRQDTSTLLSRLTYLPLVILQAAAYINENGVALVDYVSLLEERLAQSTEKAIVRLQEVFPDNSHENRSLWRIYLTHARYALESELVDRDWKTRMDLMWRYGVCLYEDGRWNEAEISIAQVLEMRKRMLGADHPDTLSSMTQLALTYDNQGRWSQAEELCLQVMETSKSVLGAEHHSTLTTMANLASVYRNQGRWSEAEGLEVQALEIFKRLLGAEHPDTLSGMGNLAWTVLGMEHPDTLTSMAHLASTYRNQGRWKEAEELELQVLETSKRVLGAEHPDTLISMNNLASTYRNQGQWKEAEELFVQVMETMKRVLGAEHSHTLASMAHLASTYRNQGRWKEAEKLDMQVMET
ncbi:TPR-like protein, partial [Zopfia rhizophila CBS 207.26]